MTDTRTGLWCIVLAAGGSSRLGRPKQLVRMHGRPLLLRAAALARALTSDRVVVVLGADALRLGLTLRRGEPRAIIVRNAGWRTGLAGSLAAGLARLPRTAAAALILLVDQPRIASGDLARLCRAWRRHPARPAAALYAGRLGVPAILPRRAFRAARSLQGDVGARALLRSYPQVSGVPMERAGFDVDTAEDLAALAR